jgi:ethanolamine utilization protein EutQ (cupin superfamily)
VNRYVNRYVNGYGYLPDTYFPDHTHDVDKIDGALSDRFHMIMNGQSMTWLAGDCLAVPKGAVHSAEVVDTESVISLDAIKG